MAHDIDMNRMRLIAASHYGIRPKAFEGWGNAGFELDPPKIQDAAPENVILVYGIILPHEEALFLRDCFGEETPISAKMFREEMEALEGDITIRINSPGGDVWEMSSMVQHIQERRNAGATVSAVIDGIAASAATVIASACSHVTIAQMGTFMIHKASGGMYGNADELIKMAEVITGMDESVAGAYAQKTGKDKDEIMAMMAEETYMNAEQALEQGFVNAVMKVDQNDDDDADATADAQAKADLAAKRNARLAGILESMNLQGALQ